MDQFFRALEVQAVLFAYMVIGIICRRSNIFTNEVRGKLSDFIVYITLPCVVFESFNMEFGLALCAKVELRC